MAESGAADRACHPVEPYLQKPQSPYDNYKPYPVQQKLDVTDPMYNEMMAAAVAATEQRQGPPSGPTAEEMNSFDGVKATQYGVLNRCIELVEGGLDVNQLDSEGVSLLHWAAINNRVPIARYYIGKGALVDRVGGSLCSTPLHWATREGHLQMVVLLMSYGADPTLYDGQGYACLHLAVQFRHSAVVAYLLAKGVDVDLPDRNGMTSLMWSAHRCTGPDPTRLLLTFGASVNKQDDVHRNTALHWAVIVSNNMAVGSLLEQRNINLNLRNAKSELAEEMATSQRMGYLAKMIQKNRAERGLDSKGFWSRLLSNREFRKWFMYIFPFYAILAVGVALDMEVVWWLRLLILAAVIQSIRLGRRNLCDEREHVCLPVGIYLATKFFMHATWFIHFWPFVRRLDILVPFVINSTLLTYTFWKCATMDPGKLRRSREDQIRAIVSMSESEVVKLEQFCSTCLIRKPIRSKHCTYCNVCVAKFDHHCPWVLNCVGANNQSYFVAYLTFLMGMISWCLYGVGVYWTNACVTSFEEDGLLLTAYNLYVCSPWVVWIAVHACAHFVWVGMLFAGQVYQVGCLGLTTNERINGTRYKHLSAAGKVTSPWHRGCLLNFVDEFGCRCCGVLKPRVVDWSEQFDVDCTSQPRTTRRVVTA